MNSIFSYDAHAARQYLTQARALAVRNSPEVQQAGKEVAQSWRRDPLCRTAAELTQLHAAVAELAMACALDVVNDAAAPAFIWVLAPGYSANGLAFPASRFGVDNPDNFYRAAACDRRSSYRIRGRFNAVRPADFNITALGHFFMDGAMGSTTGFIGNADIVTQADGSFEILATPRGGAGGIACGECVQFFVRETLGDWENQEPMQLSIERISGPELAARTENELVSEVVRLLLARAKFVPHGLQRGLYQRPPVNTIIPPAAAGPLGGLVTQLSGLGHFDLAEDEALILSVDTFAAPYVGFQLGDPWTVSYEYRDRFGSRNNFQSEFGQDGRMTLVVSLKDPGFVNWVEPYRGHSGSMTVRWQGFPPGSEPGPEMLHVTLTKLIELRTKLPPGSKFITPEERERERYRRLSAYENRLP